MVFLKVSLMTPVWHWTDHNQTCSDVSGWLCFVSRPPGGVRFALNFARAGLVDLLVQGLEKMALALAELEQLWVALHCLWETQGSWLGDKDLCQGKDRSQKSRQSSRMSFVEFELVIKTNCRAGLNKVGAGIKLLMVMCMGIVSALLNSHCASQPSVPSTLKWWFPSCL